MNPIQQITNIDESGLKIMEGLAEQMVSLLDMTDAKTSENYWAIMKSIGMSAQAQLQVAVELGLLKLASK